METNIKKTSEEVFWTGLGGIHINILTYDTCQSPFCTRFPQNTQGQKNESDLQAQITLDNFFFFTQKSLPED